MVNYYIYIKYIYFYLIIRGLVGYDGPRTIVVQGKGSGGLNELLEHLTEDQCQFAYLRVISGDQESKRAKFVFISWCGEKVSPLKRVKKKLFFFM